MPAASPVIERQGREHLNIESSSNHIGTFDGGHGEVVHYFGESSVVEQAQMLDGDDEHRIRRNNM